jgi:hypothetical protein
MIFLTSFSRELKNVSPGASSSILRVPLLPQHIRVTLKKPDVGLFGFGERPEDVSGADHVATLGPSTGEEDAGRGILVLGRGVFELLELSDFMD